MSPTIKLIDAYEVELWQYVKEPNESHLSRGYELGRRAADSGVSLFELSEAQHRVIARLMDATATGQLYIDECVTQTNRAAEFFAESLASFEMVSQGYRAQVSILEEQERRLLASQAETERANRAKSEFLAGMSHELRTPLNAILGFSQILEMDELSSEQHDGVKQIHNAGQHLLELINEVLDISHVESGRLVLSLEPVLLPEVVSEVLDLIRPLADARRIELSVTSGHNDYCVRADHQRLKQVLVNLAANAVKYNRDDGNVRIEWKSTGSNRMRISVIDTGIGIDEGSIGRLFVPFERLDAARSDAEGTGLGLVLTKQLVEAMHGTIGVNSSAGQGSTFWIEFDEAATDIQHIVDARDTSSGRDITISASQTVLYIEDNPTNMDLIERIFAKRPEITLLVATKGHTGLEIARHRQPSLVLLDLGLPDMSGEEVLRQLRADSQTEQIPVVILSADALPANIDRLLAAGATSYLTKPIDVTQLLRTIDRVAEEHSRS